jgi:hypothetical protein
VAVKHAKKKADVAANEEKATIPLVQAALMIGVHARTLTAWVKEGKASAERGKREAYLFKPSEILRLREDYWTPPATLSVPQTAGA